MNDELLLLMALFGSTCFFCAAPLLVKPPNFPRLLERPPIVSVTSFSLIVSGTVPPLGDMTRDSGVGFFRGVKRATDTRTGPVGGGSLVSRMFGLLTIGSEGCGGIGPSKISSRNTYIPMNTC